MLYPTINDLTKGKFNRYQLAVATAKCARIITDEYVRERRDAERAAAIAKENDKTPELMVNPDYRDRKAVKIAIDKIDNGDYVIVRREDDGSVTTEGAVACRASNASTVSRIHEPSGAIVVSDEDEDEECDTEPGADDNDNE